MARKEARIKKEIVSFAPGSCYTYVRIEVIDVDRVGPPKRVKKYRPAWNVIDGLSASLSSTQQLGGEMGDGPL